MRSGRLGHISFDMLEIFERVAGTGSLAAAARELGITPSTATRKLLALERALSARLFQRSTRSLKLTEAGANVLSWAQQSLVAIDQTADNVASITGAPTGLIRIAVTHFASNAYLPEVIASFSQRYPAIVIDVTTTDQLVNLIDDGYDLAYHYGVVPDSRNVGVRIDSLHRILCASPDYLERHGTPVKLQDLSRHYCVVHKPSDPAVFSFSRQGQVIHQPVRARVITDNSFNSIRMALRGAGIARIALNSAASYIKAGQLVHVLPDFKCVDSSGDVPSLWLIFANREVSHRVRLLIDHMMREVPIERAKYYEGIKATIG